MSKICVILPYLSYDIPIGRGITIISLIVDLGKVDLEKLCYVLGAASPQQRLTKSSVWD
jgi:hypothetical protein